MTALNKQAYHADGGDIGIGRLKEIADNAYGDEEKRWMAQRVLSLLDENLQLQRDKDSLEAVSIAMRDDMRDAREKLEAAEKRNAELEAREVVLPSAHDVHPLGPQSAKIFCEFHRSIVNRCADEIRKVGVKVSIKGN
ncbi:ead/Ea22-like family protein [Citrobacter freundii]|uniref:ead/Ea22-like family protein n=1 Tax=Citrobacter freundii TaxID=546 RepID=UPI002550FB92|nr:ead/Ea22-like family protein [Citrobacter freundii]